MQTPYPIGAEAPVLMSDTDAARFLAQAAFGGNIDQIAELQSIGPEEWLNRQFAMQYDDADSHWQWLVDNKYNAAPYINAGYVADAAVYCKLMTAKDVLRRRVALALSEIFVVSLHGIMFGWAGFAVAAYLDMLGKHAFGKFPELLEGVTKSRAMGLYLGTKGNTKGDAATGRQADENYAREIMQLFTIGLFKLNQDGSLKDDPEPETYTLDTVSQLAKVFTGWDFFNREIGKPEYDKPDHFREPMVFNPDNHSKEPKEFFNVELPGTEDGETELKRALKILFDHPNVAPFFCRQLIQRLVTSNPSPDYIHDVAAVFNDNGSGLRGDLKAVVRAILLHKEARPPYSPQTPAPADSPPIGKLREPVQRFVQWARTFGATSRSGKWLYFDTSAPDTQLGQSPLRSPTVFNFFRPGYALPGNGRFVAPELQITTETSVAGYINFIQTVIEGKFQDLTTPDPANLYLRERGMASQGATLVNHLNLVLAANQISAANLDSIRAIVDGMPVATDTDKTNRVKAAIMLIMCCPEYLVQK